MLHFQIKSLLILTIEYSFFTVALTNGKNIKCDYNGRPQVNLEGYLTRRIKNKWNIVCEDNLSPHQQDEAATHICRYLGFRYKIVLLS